jgi:hypothetical protein
MVACLAAYLGVRARGHASSALHLSKNAMGLWVLRSFIQINDWWIAVAYCGGSALGALIVSFTPKPASSI